ncbi:MAG: iron-containing alcohol dehydrogenase [Deltaproteobacteria bacterium]|nr:iron-containing alcohol dehydrogenase [Deltaproteobacteria bacterium]
MSRASEPAVLSDRLEDLLGLVIPCSCGRTHEVDLRSVSLRAGAIDELPDRLRALWGSGRRLLVLADRVTRQVAGERVERLLAADGQQSRTLVLPDGAGGRPHADEAGLERVEAAIEQGAADGVVAVGAGTVNDLAKLASFRRGRPYAVVATAPSMNGYTSAIAAVMRDGLKRTVDCHQPACVIGDLEILARAPAELVAAGLGDLESKPTSTADFRLAGRLRGEYYCPLPERVVLRAEARVAEAAEAIGAGDEAAIGLLCEALLLSGISMKLAGCSAPASGGEHLISHYWDMCAAEQGRVEGWHGAQVGVATVVAAALYERLAEIDPHEIDPDAVVAARPGKAQLQAAIRERHGVRASEVEAEFFAKHLDDDALRAELESLLDGWSAVWDSLADVLRTAARVRAILTAGGAPVTMTGLGLTPRHLQESFLAAREIRGRFSVLDLAGDLGVLETVAGDVLARSGCMR